MQRSRNVAAVAGGVGNDLSRLDGFILPELEVHNPARVVAERRRVGKRFIDVEIRSVGAWSGGAQCSSGVIERRERLQRNW